MRVKRLDIHKRVDKLQADIITLTAFCHYLCHEIKELQEKVQGASQAADSYYSQLKATEVRAHAQSLMLAHLREWKEN